METTLLHQYNVKEPGFSSQDSGVNQMVQNSGLQKVVNV